MCSFKKGVFLLYVCYTKSVFRRLLRKGKWSNNIIAGLVVGVVALPLAMAFAIASGVTPQAGIYTAIIAGNLYPCLVAPLFRLRALQGHLSFY